jgi:hypothetical protein
MRTRLLAGAVCAILAGCQEHMPDDLVYFMGKLVDSDGAPVANAEMALTLSTFGAKPPRPLGTARTKADGTFAIELLYAQIISWENLNSPWRTRLVSQASPEGAQVAFEVGQVTGDTWLGPMLRPSAAIAVSLSESQIGLSLDTIPDLSERALSRGGPPALPRWELWAGPLPSLRDELDKAVPLWAADATASTAHFDRRVLEDFAEVRATLSAAYEHVPGDDDLEFAPPGRLIPANFQAFERWPAVKVERAPGIAPPSRGARCAVDGELLPTCPFTDGEMASVSETQIAALLGRQNEWLEPMNEIELTFASPLRPNAVAIRGAEIGWMPTDAAWIAILARANESSEWREVARAELLAAVPGVDSAHASLETRSLYGFVTWPAPAEPCVAIKVRLLSRDPSGAEAPEPMFSLGEISVFGER